MVKLRYRGSIKFISEYFEDKKRNYKKKKQFTEDNVEIYLDNIKKEFTRRIDRDFKKNRKYHIKLKFKILLEDCSFMFYNCDDIISIDLRYFDASNVKNMSNMFRSCRDLISVNLSNLNTTNLTNMDVLL